MCKLLLLQSLTFPTAPAWNLFRRKHDIVRAFSAFYGANWYEIVAAVMEQEEAVLVNLDKQQQATNSQLLGEAKVLLSAPHWLKTLVCIQD